jgi:hypothetical protein
VARLLRHRKIKAEKPFFLYAEQGQGGIDTGDLVFPDGSPLVKNPGKTEPLLGEPLGGFLGPQNPRPLLIPPKGKPYIPFRLEAPGAKGFRPFHDADEDTFHVQGSPAVDKPLPRLRPKGIHAPLFRLHRHHVVMGQDKHRLWRGGTAALRALAVRHR